MTRVNPPESLAMFLATREKRLDYFKRIYGNLKMESGRADEISGLLSTYAQLMAKVLKAKEQPERDEARARLLDLDRELTRLFELRRLATADIDYKGETSVLIMKPR
jgi:hypothetical protein